MTAKKLPEPATVRQLLRYEPDTGKLFWRYRDEKWFKDARSYSVWNMRYAMTEALTSFDGSGYLHGNLLDARTKAHRAAWVIAHGEWPEGDIDHINGIRTDNRLVNLRSVPRAENLRNSARRYDNQSGYPGVDFVAKCSKWRARLSTQHLGLFATLQEAADARALAAAAQGYHANHGRDATITPNRRKEK